MEDPKLRTLRFRSQRVAEVRSPAGARVGASIEFSTACLNLSSSNPSTYGNDAHPAERGPEATPEGVDPEDFGTCNARHQFVTGKSGSTGVRGATTGPRDAAIDLSSGFAISYRDSSY